ncbi:MAG: hypothetical protein PHU40_06915 [Sulfurimonas sp.]|nr:hypothetical protein [Sulfurimonas sp.]
MKKIICDIHNGVQNSRKTIEFLTQNSSWTWIGEYPIAVINEITRVKDEESLKNLEKINFFNEQGFSKNSYTKKELDYLTQNIPSSIKTAYCLCLKKRPTNDYIFSEKFAHDRWKKIQDEGIFEALVESSKFLDSDNSRVIETELRDIMRSAKEIPSLKTIGFVWIVTVPNSTKIEDILQHYFLDNHIYVEKGRKTTYIAWGERLVDINMRYFVNTP